MSEPYQIRTNPSVVLQFTGGINHKRAYNNSTAYVLGDAVLYEGSSYVAMQNTTGNLPTNTTYWQLLVEKGEDGDPGTTIDIEALEEVIPDPTDWVLINDGTGLRKSHASYFQQIFVANSQEESDEIYSTYYREGFPLLIIRTDITDGNYTIAGETASVTATFYPANITVSNPGQENLTAGTGGFTVTLNPATLTVDTNLLELSASLGSFTTTFNDATLTIDEGGGGGETMALPFSYAFPGYGALDSTKITTFANMDTEIAGGGEITTVPPQMFLDGDFGKFVCGTVTGGTGKAVFGFEIKDNVTMPSSGLEIKWKLNSYAYRGAGTNGVYALFVSDTDVTAERLWGGSPNSTANVIAMALTEYINNDGFNVARIFNGTWNSEFAFYDYPSQGIYYYKALLTATTLTISRSSDGIDYTEIYSGSHGVTFNSNILHIGLHCQFGDTTSPADNGIVFDELYVSAI